MIAKNENAGRREGERRKDAALEILKARREVYVRRGQRALLGVLLAGSPMATADDVREAVTVPADIDPRLFGSVPGSLARAGIIRRTGFVKSARPERHASYLQAWQLANESAARDWLARNPDTPLDDELPLFAAQQKSSVAATTELEADGGPGNDLTSA